MYEAYWTAQSRTKEPGMRDLSRQRYDKKVQSLNALVEAYKKQYE